MNFIHIDLVLDEEVFPAIAKLLAYPEQDRLDGESFGDFCDRKGNDDLLAFSA
ncbi:MAG: hypothetical protein R3C28_00855 [Pirellulaceae bacterium]